jgi:hypothetical protein
MDRDVDLVSPLVTPLTYEGTYPTLPLCVSTTRVTHIANSLHGGCAIIFSVVVYVCACVGGEVPLPLLLLGLYRLLLLRFSQPYVSLRAGGLWTDSPGWDLNHACLTCCAYVSVDRSD